MPAMPPPQDFQLNKKRKRRHKTNTLLNVIEIEDNTDDNDELDTNVAEEDYIIQDVQIPHILTGSVTMARAINNLTPLCPNNVYIAHPSILTEAHHFNITLSQLLQECNVPTASLQPGQIILFPTFFW